MELLIYKILITEKRIKKRIIIIKKYKKKEFIYLFYYYYYFFKIFTLKHGKNLFKRFYFSL